MSGGQGFRNHLIPKGIHLYCFFQSLGKTEGCLKTHILFFFCSVLLNVMSFSHDNGGSKGEESDEIK